jgi:hypothetical protein
MHSLLLYGEIMSDEVQTQEAQVTEQSAPAPEATTQTVPQLQLQDLLTAAQVIQLASSRGAIKPEEMEAVGGLYTRLLAFLQASGALQPAEPAPADTPAQ